jgi:hypothetical protein
MGPTCHRIAPGANVARMSVAAALAHLGRIDQARAAIVELRRLQPNATMERIKLASFAHDCMYDLCFDGFARRDCRKLSKFAITLRCKPSLTSDSPCN